MMRTIGKSTLVEGRIAGGERGECVVLLLLHWQGRKAHGVESSRDGDGTERRDIYKNVERKGRKDAGGPGDERLGSAAVDRLA